MIEDGKTARQLYAELKAAPTRRRFGFGRRAAVLNIDVQCAYTQPGTYVTAYETNPRQIDHINAVDLASKPYFGLDPVGPPIWEIGGETGPPCGPPAGPHPHTLLNTDNKRHTPIGAHANPTHLPPPPPRPDPPVAEPGTEPF